jgi:hypothetical protein
MARRPLRKATPQDRDESRYIASRIQDASRKGHTQKEIGKAFGMDERTVRKVLRGETPGTRIYKSKVSTPPPKASPSIVRVDLEIKPDSNGRAPNDPRYNGEVRTINARVPALPAAKGVRTAPTPFDVFRLPNMEAVALAEGKRMQNIYQIGIGVTPRIVGVRPIVRRNPATVLYTITGAIR